MSPQILSILKYRSIWLTGIGIDNSRNSELPCATILFQGLRQKIYAVLLEVRDSSAPGKQNRMILIRSFSAGCFWGIIFWFEGRHYHLRLCATDRNCKTCYAMLNILEAVLKSHLISSFFCLFDYILVSVALGVDVTEWVSGKNVDPEVPVSVFPIALPWLVPPLHDLWTMAAAEADSTRLRAFLSCMNSDLDCMRQLPPDFLFLCCVLRFSF